MPEPEETDGAMAALDEAHIGDIQGAFGTIRQHDTGARRSWGARLLTLLAIMGPGLIVMVGDNDAGGVATYSQAGQNYGLTLLWTLPLLIPVLIVNQEMVVRLGAVTGVGHARLINERFGKFWGMFSVGDLFILNFLTIATEFIGISLALGYFGVSEYVSVPIAAVTLIAMTATGSFRRWERFMFVFVIANFLVIPLAFMSHPVRRGLRRGPHRPRACREASTPPPCSSSSPSWAPPSPPGSSSSSSRTSWTSASRPAGSTTSVLTPSLARSSWFSPPPCSWRSWRRHSPGTPQAGHFTNAEGVAEGLQHYVGRAAGAMFAIILLNASIIGAAAVTLSTSYAFGDVFGAHHSLHRSFRDAKFFYGVFGAMVLLAAGIVLIPGAPLGVITTGVQALAGVLLPSATVFLLLLCNDKEVLGPWVNRPWLNVVSGIIVSILLMMSLVLMATTLFSSINVTDLALILGGVLLVSYVVMGVILIRARKRRPVEPLVSKERRANWRMPPLNLLSRPKWSRGRLLGMWALRGYLVLAVVLLLVKAIQLGLHGKG